jgi:SAM-dependent methyltransferase
MISTGKHDLKNILDFPSGYGRIARHLRAVFPTSEITACDIEEIMVYFCHEEFQCKPVISKDDFKTLDFNQKFDFIWCGSLFTHLPEHKFNDCIDLFSRSLQPDGVAIFTTHGRYSYEYGAGRYLPADIFRLVQRRYDQNGFGYSDYIGARDRDINNYGISLSSPAYVMNAISQDPTLTIISFRERGWNEHQDVVVIQKKSVQY